ncbi:MAG: DUF1549 domain-containing protein [bacterium]|nr:DUF1549 domain-containing protein [bacterium]
MLKRACLSTVATAWLVVLAVQCVQGAEPSRSEQVLAPLFERFGADKSAGAGAEAAGVDSVDVELGDLDEIPDFQKHISPLLGRLGCNGRACHGSFQGQGGFQLSLFGYDFNADYQALLEDGAARVDVDDKAESLILTKPVDEDMHEGGKRFEHGGWEYRVLRRWIDAGAPFSAKSVQKLDRLEVTPAEIQFAEPGQQQQLQVIAHWEDGTREDVTCLARFSTNDESVAAIDEQGLVTCGQAGDTHVVVSYDNAVVPVLTLRPLSGLTGDAYPQIATATEIDRLVVSKLKKMGIVPSDKCSDEEFLRRASLDVTGTLPSPEEVLEFIGDKTPDKRDRKIEELLSRPSYAAQWTTFLCDITGNNDDQLRNFMPQQVPAANHWYQWIYQRLEQNVPYDQIVAGIVTATSRLPEESYTDYCEAMSEVCRDNSGEKFAERPGLVYYWARRNFQTPEDRAIGFAYSFLGVRIQCAQCHKHPFDQWSKNDFDQFEKLFNGVQARQNTMSPDAKSEYNQLVSTLGVDKKLNGNQLRRELGEMLKQGKVVPLPELVVAKPRPSGGKNKKQQAANAKQTSAKLLGGDWVDLEEGDVRGELMEWLVAEENPYFSKALVNRVWAQYFGVGIVDPPDDLNLANAPSNAPLLDYLADGFRSSGFDLKWLHREILSSDTYQRSWETNETNALDKHNFSRSLLRRLPAEATYDAVRTALAKDELADRSRDLDIPRALTKAGASPRANQRDDESYALTVFGRSIRESNCDCDRSSEPSLLQTVFLANDSAVQQWLGDPKTSWVSQVGQKFGWQSAKAPAAETELQQQKLQKMLERFEQQRAAVDQRLKQAKKAGNSKLQAALQRRQADLMQRAEEFAKKNGIEGLLTGIAGASNGESPKKSQGMSQEDAAWIAEQAYLRTLSRLPQSGERERVVQYLTSEKEPLVAVEGLMWSLINTKEFILNH